MTFTKCFFIRQALKGWKKERVRSDQRRTVSYALLVCLLVATNSQCSSSFEAVLLRACFCLPFVAALRVMELVPSSQARDGGVLSDDMVLANGSLRVCIRRSKTDTFRRGEWVPLHGVSGLACPVREVAVILPSAPPVPISFCTKMVPWSPDSNFKLSSSVVWQRWVFAHVSLVRTPSA